MPAQPVVFGAKSDFAYQRLRDMIIQGELPAGSRLKLRDLAATLGLSEMPVREALRMLQQDELVEFESHRGATVADISREAVLEGVSTRMWLEVLAVREAVARHTPKTLARAKGAFGSAEKAAAAGDALRFAEANRAFHQAVEAPAADLLRSLIDDLWDRVWQSRRTASLFTLRPERIALAQAEHSDLLRAVMSGDAKTASETMARHREASLAAWRETLALSSGVVSSTDPRPSGPLARLDASTRHAP